MYHLKFFFLVCNKSNFLVKIYKTFKYIFPICASSIGWLQWKIRGNHTIQFSSYFLTNFMLLTRRYFRVAFHIWTDGEGYIGPNQKEKKIFRCKRLYLIDFKICKLCPWYKTKLYKTFALGTVFAVDSKKVFAFS